MLWLERYHDFYFQFFRKWALEFARGTFIMTCYLISKWNINNWLRKDKSGNLLNFVYIDDCFMFIYNRFLKIDLTSTFLKTKIELSRSECCYKHLFTHNKFIKIWYTYEWTFYLFFENFIAALKNRRFINFVIPFATPRNTVLKLHEVCTILMKKKYKSRFCFLLK